MVITNVRDISNKMLQRRIKKQGYDCLLHHPTQHSYIILSYPVGRNDKYWKWIVHLPRTIWCDMKKHRIPSATQ